jgi:hypothetical protein
MAPLDLYLAGSRMLNRNYPAPMAVDPSGNVACSSGAAFFWVVVDKMGDSAKQRSSAGSGARSIELQRGSSLAGWRSGWRSAFVALVLLYITETQENAVLKLR